MKIHKQLVKNVGVNFVPVKFKEPLDIKNSIHYLLVSIKGRGGTYAALNNGDEKTEEYMGINQNGQQRHMKRHFYERTLDGRDKNGQYAKPVKFQYYFKDNGYLMENNVIADIHFNIK